MNIAIRRQRAWLVLAAGGLLASLLLLRRRTADRPRWYRTVYRLMYRLGLIIWQRRTPPAELVALIEGPSPLPPGRALDLGCGTGTDTIYLATHGWEVTAIDMVPKALTIARRNAIAAGVTPRVVQGDVTRLSELGVGAGYTLLLDVGCFHTLPEDQRPAYVTSVSDAAAPGATLLLYGFRRPPRAAPMHAGVTLDEVQQRFVPAGWHLVNAERDLAADIPAVPRAADRFELWRYQLHRAST
jgi:SAM-dependent methyltransferase